MRSGRLSALDTRGSSGSCERLDSRPPRHRGRDSFFRNYDWADDAETARYGFCNEMSSRNEPRLFCDYLGTLWLPEVIQQRRLARCESAIHNAKQYPVVSASSASS